VKQDNARSGTRESHEWLSLVKRYTEQSKQAKQRNAKNSERATLFPRKKGFAVATFWGKWHHLHSKPRNYSGDIIIFNTSNHYFI
jgi:hypothetical protein